MRTPGGADVALAIVVRHARLVGYEVSRRSDAVPDKDTLDAECLDDYPALVRFHHAIQEKMDIAAVDYALMHAKHELDETFAAYAMEDDSE